MRFQVLDKPCMLFHEFLLRKECLAVNLALYPPLLRGTWNGRGWFVTLMQEIEVCRGVTTLMQGEDYTEVVAINSWKITMEMLLFSTSQPTTRQWAAN
jgi:hypothetical protein